MQLPILIGGPPRAGKSTLAEGLSGRLGVKWISTDTIRKDLKKNHADQRADFPNIFSTVGITAEEFWRTRTPEDVMNIELAEARELWPIVRSYITSGEYGIIEGISLLPELIWNEFSTSIQAVFLIDPDKSRVAKTIAQHGLWSNTKPYADWVKDLELRWVMAHNEWYRKQAKKYSQYPLIEIQSRETLIDQVLSILK